jgi:hypothetical protein
MNTAKPSRTLNTLRAAWEKSYGRAFAAGLLAYSTIPDIVRGLAFQQLAEQDESIDLRKVQVKLGEAVVNLLAELKV